MSRTKFKPESEDRCRKCLRDTDLIIHHKLAIADGGEDVRANIHILCGNCHAEWHRMEGLIPYDDWVKLPTPEFIMLLLHDPELKHFTLNDVMSSWTYSRAHKLSDDIPPSKLMDIARKAEQGKITQSERTKAGLERARAQGKRIGRPGIDSRAAAQIRHLASENPGMAPYAISKIVGCDPKTVKKHLEHQ